jgi:uncharacterized protein
MIKRNCNILIYIQKNKSVFLFGARGTGKTSYLGQILTDHPKSIFLDFLNNTTFRRYFEDPDLLIGEVDAFIEKNGQVLVVIDEVQKIGKLLDTVHLLIEKHKGKATFVLTGSSARKLKRGGANLLAGRAITNEMYPISSFEHDIVLERALQFGTLPGIYFDQGLEVPNLDAYVNTYLREEVLEESLVRRLENFIRFIEIAGQMNGEPVNFTKMAKQCKVTGNTVADYYSILEDTLIAYRLNGYDHSVKRQLLQSPKFYFFDCGVLNAINGELRTELKKSSFRYGKLFETWIILEAVRLNSYQNLGLRFNYWRDKSGKEVDLIVSRSKSKPLVAIEIKSFREPEPLPNLALVAQDFPEILRWCLCDVPRKIRIDHVIYYPWREGLAALLEI